ncbi:hypothetical protein KKD20_06685, partial [Patescibacteria group bacterium]|nr:hypothetical protein [Patescibacteria group bacterium]
VGVKELTERLSHLAKQEGLKIDKDVLVTIAARSEGCIRDAESLLQQILSLGEKRITMDEASLVLPRSDIKLVINFCEHLFKNEISGALQLVNNLLEEGVDLEQFVGDTIEFLRKLLVYSVDPELATLKAELDEDIEEKLKNLNTQTKTPRIAFLISLFIDKKREIKQAEIPPLPLELLVVEFCENQENKKSIQPKTDHPLGENQKNNQTHSAGSGQAIEQSARNARASEAGGSNNISLDNDINKDKDVSNVNERAGDISFDSIKNNWDKILLEIKKQNHSISAFLKTGQLIAFSNQILQIRFSYKFHQDRIKDVKNKRIVEQCISQVVGQPVKLEFKTLEVNNNAGKTNRVIEDALEVFGGELVEE